MKSCHTENKTEYESPTFYSRMNMANDEVFQKYM